MEEIKIKPTKLEGKDREHKVWINYYETSDEDCDGEVYWEEVMEGYVCTKCNLYTGVK